MKLCAIGTGAISKSMIPEFHRSSVLECVAVCSRGEETGKAIAEQFGLEKVYTSLDAMLADPEIEMVYIGSPNAIHYSQTKAALRAGKHVLCEKPFAPTEEEAAELIALAKEKKLFLFEAITTAHHPHYAVVKEKLPLLGRIKLVMATFCQFSSRYPALLAGKVSPVLDPAYKGGALMDINLYNIHFTVGLFGAPENIRYRANLHSNGVDTSGVLTMEYPDFLVAHRGQNSFNYLEQYHAEENLRLGHTKHLTGLVLSGGNALNTATVNLREVGCIVHDKSYHNRRKTVQALNTKYKSRSVEYQNNL